VNPRAFVSPALAPARLLSGERVARPSRRKERPTVNTNQSRRRSPKSPHTSPISLQDISTLFHYALRSNHREVIDAEHGLCRLRRPYPSAGALFPTEFYLIAGNVSGLPPCVTHYSPQSHKLSVLAVRNAASGRSPFITQSMDDIPAALIITSIFGRARAKYGDRGYRFALLEAGHAAQNVCLVATGMGLGCLMWGGYYDDDVHDVIGVDGVTEAVLSCVLLGGRAP